MRLDEALLDAPVDDHGNQFARGGRKGERQARLTKGGAVIIRYPGVTIFHPKLTEEVTDTYKRVKWNSTSREILEQERQSCMLKLKEPSHGGPS